MMDVLVAPEVRTLPLTGNFMRRLYAIACSLVALAVASPSVWAKGDMIRIEIRGDALLKAVAITDPKIQNFHVWTGPGVNDVAVEDAEGFIANWKNGAVPRPPARVPRYEISWYAGCHQQANCRSTQPSLVYVVVYARDRSSGEGFVYLPGKGEPSYDLNVRSIYRGVEGRWFRTTESWDRFVDPVITRSSS
jgi:hypothetical protein